MNQQTHFNQLKTVLQELYTTFEDGLDIASPDLTTVVNNTGDTASALEDVVTNTANIANGTNDITTNTGIVSACVDQVNHHLEVDTNAINGVTMAVNSGNKSNGCQRVTIATDDVNLQKISNCVNVGTSKVEVNASISGVPQTNLIYLNGNAIAVNTGSSSTGTQRVCIADNDTNLSGMATNIGAMTTDLDTLTNRIEGVASGYVTGLGVVLRGVKFGAGDESLAVANGDVNTGTLRVTIADNDTNLAAIKQILQDVWDSTAHALRTV